MRMCYSNKNCCGIRRLGLISSILITKIHNFSMLWQSLEERGIKLNFLKMIVGSESLMKLIYKIWQLIFIWPFYQNEIVNFQLLPLLGYFPRLQDDDFMFIHKPLSKLEIKEAIFSMGSLKALSLNGLHTLFYQSQWEMVGDSMCSTIFENFNHLGHIQLLNETSIMLILK